MREKAMGGEIDDEARRAGAAQMAERLMAVFGMFNEEGEEDDGPIDIYGGIGNGDEATTNPNEMLAALSALADESKQNATNNPLNNN